MTWYDMQFLMWDDQDQITQRIEIPKKEVQNGCDHTWKRYIGFNEIYDYCTLCDKKKGER